MRNLPPLPLSFMHPLAVQGPSRSPCYCHLPCKVSCNDFDLFLYVWKNLTTLPWLARNSPRSVCLYLRSAGIKGTCLHSQLTLTSFPQQIWFGKSLYLNAHVIFFLSFSRQFLIFGYSHPDQSCYKQVWKFPPSGSKHDLEQPQPFWLLFPCMFKMLPCQCTGVSGDLWTSSSKSTWGPGQDPYRHEHRSHPSQERAIGKEAERPGLGVHAFNCRHWENVPSSLLSAEWTWAVLLNIKYFYCFIPLWIFQ